MFLPQSEINVFLLNAVHHSRLAQTAFVRPTRLRALNVACVDFAVVDGEGGCLFVCALPLVSKSENAKEVLCALRGPLSASKSENAAKVCAFDASSSRAVAVLLVVWLYQTLHA